MSVHYVKGGNGILGTLGGLATIGGALTGMPLLSALGTGIGMINSGSLSGLGGGGAGMSGATSLGDILNGIICGGWTNPASGNLANKNPEPMPSEEDIFKKWNPYNTGGYNSWLQ